jgi:hypothetical protein
MFLGRKIMKKIFVIALFLLATFRILYGEIHQGFSTTNIDSLSKQNTVEHKREENQQKYKLKMPECISKNNPEEVFGLCINGDEIEQLITKKNAIELKQLPLIVKKTIKELTNNRKGENDDVHEIVAKLSNGNINENISSALRTGERMCQVFDFSFFDNSVQLVGTHRCLLERFNGDLSIFKFTGNRLFATFKPYKESALVFFGRSYLPEHQQQRYDKKNHDNKENNNFGNEVGYAFSINKKLVLLSISQRGFTQPDSTFFSCVIIN